jgi:hypothetical protein
LDKRIEVNQARTDEKLDAIEKNLSDLKKQADKQDNRLWVLIRAIAVGSPNYPELNF